MTQPIKAWKIRSKLGPDGIAVIAFAPSPSEAKTIALCADEFEHFDYIDLQATRYPDADIFASRTETPDPKTTAGQFIYRQLGWRAKFDQIPCRECGLFAWDLLPESRISLADDNRLLCASCQLKLTAKEPQP